MKITPAAGKYALWGVAASTAFAVLAEEYRRPVNRAPHEPHQDEITVYAPPRRDKPDNRFSISAGDMTRNGSQDFGSVMRYQPLVSATGAPGGSSNGRSGFDRGGYTGYNIRGLESNRVGIDIDDIPQPAATGRSYAGRAGLNTFGIGRDYIDPWLYGRVDIQSGAVSVDTTNLALGGAVSFRPKSADDYLYPGKTDYFSGISGFDSTDRSWHNGVTAAAGREELSGILVYSRRDGQQARSHRDTLAAYPANWHSDALLLSGSWQANAAHRITAGVDYYHRVRHTRYDTWSPLREDVMNGTARQNSQTRRWGLSLRDEWHPRSGPVDSLISKVFYQHTESHDNTRLPGIFGGEQTVFSDYNTDTVGGQSTLAMQLGRHTLRAGINASMVKTARPFTQSPALSVFDRLMQPEADSRSLMLGAFAEDRIDLAPHVPGAALIPGGRVAYQQTSPRNAAALARGSALINGSDIERLYGDVRDTRLLPALTLEYALSPGLLTWLQYRRSAQFPGASQLYGSWNLGSGYAGPRQYALIGNQGLKTETGNNLEWGLRGEAAPGLVLRGSLYYSQYRDFIASTRYQRRADPARFRRVPGNIHIIYQAENRDRAYLYGAEMSARLDYGAWSETLSGLNTTLALGYAAGKSKSRYPGDSYRALDSVPPLKAVAGIGWDGPEKRYGLALTGTFVQGKRAQATRRESYANTGAPLGGAGERYMRISGYGVLDGSGYWQAAKQVTLRAGVYNLTDRKYRDYLSSRNITESTRQDAWQRALAVMPGRTWQMGVTVEF